MFHEKFISTSTEISPSKKQLQVVSTILAIDRWDYFGERGKSVTIPGFDNVDVKVGNDGFKLLALSDHLKLYSKIFWTPEEATFVAEKEIEIGKLLSDSITTIKGLEGGDIEFGQVVVGVLDRAVIFKYRDDIKGELEFPNEQLREIYRIIKQTMIRDQNVYLPNYFANHLSALVTDTGVVFHDLVADSHKELCDSLGISL